MIGLDARNRVQELEDKIVAIRQLVVDWRLMAKDDDTEGRYYLTYAADTLEAVLGDV